MDMSNLGGGLPNNQFDLPTSFFAVLRAVEQNVKTELARRAAVDKTIVAEIGLLRAVASGNQLQECDTSRSPPVEGTVTERDRLPQLPSIIRSSETKDSISREDHDALLQENERLKSEKDILQSRLDAAEKQKEKDAQIIGFLQHKRREDIERIKLWSDELDQMKSRRKSKKAADIPQLPTSSSRSRSEANDDGDVHNFKQPKEPTESPFATHRSAAPNVQDPAPLFDFPLQGQIKRIEHEPAITDMASVPHTNAEIGQQYSSPPLPPIYSGQNGNMPHMSLNGISHLAHGTMLATDNKSVGQSSISTSSELSLHDNIGDDTTLVENQLDPVVVVAARPVKRKRGVDNLNRIEQKKVDPGNGDPGDPVQVKSEYSSSSPILLKKPVRATQQSQVFDLDDVEEHVPTPKRNRIFSGDEPSDIHEQSHSLEDIDRVQSIVRASSAPPASQSQHQSTRQPAPRNFNRQPNSALRTMDLNLQSPPRSTGIPTHDETKTYRRGQGRSVAAIPMVSEDGESVDSFDDSRWLRKRLGLRNNMPETPESSGVPTMREHYEGRLGAILDTPVPAKQVLDRMSSAGKSLKKPTSLRAQNIQLKSKSMNPLQSLRGASPRQTLLTISSSTPKGPRSPGSHSSNRIVPCPTTSSRPASKVRNDNKSSMRLRDIPLEEQKMGNFKINPIRNKGLPFAFTEVVRSRDERKCLPGCTRPECCGAHFKRLVEFGLDVRPDRNLWEPEDEDESTLLIMEYIGANSRAKVHKMTEDERQRCLVDAKIAKAAKLWGKHKHLHQRPRSPPGFWRVDFPSTQEQEEDRRISAEMEREKIEARWREALKQNGKGLWKFADE